ncbi:MAG: helix-turn-helix transcriptional regulator [Bacillota bacterium]|nr:helix-turn-helix transcriptional regulator [Bacillota bacterium]
MNHKQAKKILLSDPEVKKEYDALEPEYAVKNALIKLRDEKGLTQRDLAVLIGAKQSAIARLESGRYNPSVKLLGKIAAATGKKLSIRFK